MATEKKDYSFTKYFGENLAELLGNRIVKVHKGFNTRDYVQSVKKKCEGLSYKQRVELHADELFRLLPPNFERSAGILVSVLGEENKKETGMFTNFYWVLPVGKFVEKYGLEHPDAALDAIEEITKRNTGEYAVRPYIRRYPKQTLKRMNKWAESDNFHLRRLASEGLRPKLPWATKLETFLENPDPVFQILEKLKEDEVMFVKKSVGNHLADWIKVNPTAVSKLIQRWSKSKNVHTQWIVKRATRKFEIDFRGEK